MIMKTLILLASLSLGVAGSASAALYSSTYNTGFENSGNITDGNASPWSDTRTVSGITEAAIGSVSIVVNISGGYNGDLYGYLSHAGVLIPLLNRVGRGTGNAFGASDAGLNVLFTDAAANNIHTYQTVSGYSLASEATWQPDGRTINPVTSAPSAYDAAGTVTFANLAGLDPNGDWTLVFGDLSAGGGQAQVLSWGVNITAVTAVPEPINVALGVFGAVFAGVAVMRRRRARKLSVAPSQ